MKASFTACMGIYLGLLQTGYFFHLEVWLTATYPGFLTVLSAWMAGTVSGLHFSKARVLKPSMMVVLLFASLTAYYLSFLLLKLYPYQSGFLPLHGALIFVSGVQGGVFFQTYRNLFPSSSSLFLWENNGFILGWVGGFAGFVLYGTGFTLTAPLVTLGVTLVLHRRLE